MALLIFLIILLINSAMESFKGLLLKGVSGTLGGAGEAVEEVKVEDRHNKNFQRLDLLEKG